MLRYSLLLVCLIFLNVSCQNSSENKNTSTEKTQSETTSDTETNTAISSEQKTSKTENEKVDNQNDNVANPISTKVEENKIEISRFPKNIEEFLELRNQIATTPQGGASMFIIALMMYVQSSDNDFAPLTVAITKSHLQENSKGYKGYMPNPSDLRLIKDQLNYHPYLPNSYVINTSPQNGYELPSERLAFTFSTNKYSGSEEEGSLKLFVPSSGADSPRPIKVVRNDKGIWKADEWSSLLVGIRTPPKADNDNL
jgi:hypothetical protein